MGGREEQGSGPGRSRFSLRSINQKVILSVALLLIGGLGGLVAYQSYTSRVLALSTFDDSNAILTATLGDNMSSAVKYARTEALANSYKEIAQNPRAGLDGVIVQADTNGDRVADMAFLVAGNQALLASDFLL